MNQQHFIIYDRPVDPLKIVLVKAYAQPLDPARIPYKFLNATVVLTRRPFRLPARRTVKQLAETLGFHYLDTDNIAVNPMFKAKIEPFSPTTEMDRISWRSAQTLLTLTSHGIIHRQHLLMPPEEVASILAMPPRPTTFLNSIAPATLNRN